MSAQELYFGLVIAAFTTFAVSLLMVSLWAGARRPAPQPKIQVVVHRAARPASSLAELGRQPTTY